MKRLITYNYLTHMLSPPPPTPSPTTPNLNWLLVSSRIEFKIATLTFKVLIKVPTKSIHFMIRLPLTFLPSSLIKILAPTRISLMCLKSDQKWAADFCPLLHLLFGTLLLNIFVPPIPHRSAFRGSFKTLILISTVTSTIVINSLYSVLGFRPTHLQ